MKGWHKCIQKLRNVDIYKSNWKPDVVTYLGEKVQIDINYVPNECLLFNTNGIKYYQITAIDDYSRKRMLFIVDEKSVTNTSRFYTRKFKSLS